MQAHNADVNVLIFELELINLEKMIIKNSSYFETEQTSMALLIDNKPVVVMDTQPDIALDPSLIAKKNDLYMRAIRGEMGEPTTLSGGGKSLVAAYHYIPQLNLGMIITYEKEKLFEKVQELTIQVVFLTCSSLFFVIVIVFFLGKSLWNARRKSEILLKNILPKFVLEELKEKKHFDPRDIQNVSVLFIDMVNFTAFASQHPAEEVVSILNELFSIFDALCTKYSLEKIKTIGDAYMAAAGLISYQADHAERAIDMALEVILAIQHYNLDHLTDFSVRIGIDSGSVMAGILGTQRFSFDIWGNCVNCASRMESTGVNNQVQITTQTYDALQNKEKYHMTSRNNVSLKGIGFMNTYLIERCGK